MATIVVPFRPDGKQRLAPLPAVDRARLAGAMLADVLEACTQVAPTRVVAPEAAWPAVEATSVELVPDPGRGQGAAVVAALAGIPAGPVLVVNADLPCVTPRDLYALLGALPAGGLALAEAADGTTNALALASPALFEPLYGPGSAARFRSLGDRALGAGPGAGAQSVPIPNLVDDVDTVDDLRRLADRVGPATRRALAERGLYAGAAA